MNYVMRLLWWVRKPGNGVILDRRAPTTCAIIAMLFVALASFYTAMAMAAASTDKESLREHAVAVMDFQWWMIGGLFAVSAAALVFIYLSGRRADRAQFNVLFQKLDDMNDGLQHYVTRTQHDEIDHSLLCPVCRNMKLKIDNRG